MQSPREPRILRIATLVYDWRVWVLVPLAAALAWIPMPNIIRILIGVVYGALVVVPFVLRIVGNFVAGYRGQ